jgi:hypothetical protein
MQQQQAQAQAQHQGYSQGQEYAEMMHRAELMQLQNGGYADDQGGYDLNYGVRWLFTASLEVVHENLI